MNRRSIRRVRASMRDRESAASLVRVVKCLLRGGHRWAPSHSHAGYHTCVRCRSRRSSEWLAKRPGQTFER
jgi:hypothetical protein